LVGEQHEHRGEHLKGRERGPEVCVCACACANGCMFVYEIECERNIAILV
jgi:hypothetical protein